MDVFITPEESDLKYLSDLSDEVTYYVSQLVLEICHGVSRNIGVQDPDRLASRPPKRLTKGFLDGMKEIAHKLKGMVGRDRSIHPFQVRGLNLYRKGKPLTGDQWREFERQVLDYLRPHLEGLNEEMAVKGVLLAMAAREAEAQQKQVSEYGKHSLEQVEQDAFAGYIPDSIRSAEERLHINRDIQRAMVYGHDHAAQYVQRVNDEVREAIRQQVVNAHRLGKTPEQLASDLYWMKDEVPEMKKYTAQALLRNWKRVAVTELAYIHEAGKMAANEDKARQSMNAPELAIYYVFSRGTCPWCRTHQGTLVRHIPLDQVGNEADDSLSSRGIEDPHTDIAIWQGKNNVGYRQAQWRVCTPAHPWNTATMVRIHPDAQEYDQKTHAIRYKRVKDFEQYIPEEFKQQMADTQARNEARWERIEDDERRGVYRKPSEYYREDLESAAQGTDDQGRPLATSQGRTYIGVKPEEFTEALERWRGDRSLPIPVATNQKDYESLFGDNG
jgi:hypothetical protein